MTSIILKADTLERLKRAARRQLPTVKHSHILEALGRALGFKSYAALCTHLDEKPPLPLPFVSRCFVPVSRTNLRERLVELGYPQAPEWPLSFSDLEDGTDVVSDGETAGWDPSRDPVVLLEFFKRLGVERPELGLLVSMAAARDPRSDIDSPFDSTIPLNWQPGPSDEMTGDDREDAIEDMIDEVVQPTLRSLIQKTAQFREETKDGVERAFSMALVMDVRYDRDTGLTYRFSPWLQAQLVALAAMSSTDGP
jgi:hypothetical protein